MLHYEIIPHGHEKLHMRVYICERPRGLRAIGGCKSNRSTVRHLYMFTAYLYLTKITSAGDIRAELDV